MSWYSRHLIYMYVYGNVLFVSVMNKRDYNYTYITAHIIMHNVSYLLGNVYFALPLEYN